MNQKVLPSQLHHYVSNHPGSSIKEMSQYFDVTTATIHAIINKLLGDGSIVKRGSVPRVQYYIYDVIQTSVTFPADIVRLLDQERYQISKVGQELIGVSGFVSRCHERDQEPQAAVLRWKGHIDYLDSIKTPYGICATHKLHDYQTHHLQDLRYGNIYALPEFGKTKYGTWMELAKTYPSNQLFSLLVDSVLPYINAVIIDQKIDALCFAQPTAKRTMQIMHYLTKTIRADLPRVAIQKTPGFFPAQKQLKHRDDRIANAQASFELRESKATHYHHVLIIDDAVGSGATIAEIGNKIIDQGVSDLVTGFSLVGTANGIFDQVKQFEVLASV